MEILFCHTATCPMCRMVEMKLKQKNIEYKDCQNVEEMLSMGVTHTPVLIVDGKHLEGADLMQWLKTQGEDK